MSVVEMINGPPEEGPERAGRTIHEGLAKSSTREVGMQVPCGDHSEVSPKNSLREDSQASWGDTSRVVSTTGYRAFGRESDARPCSYVAEYSSEVQHCPHDWIFEGQERNPSPPERSEDKRHFARPELLVEGVLRKHCRLGRERHSRIHQASGEAPTRTRSVESRTQLTAPFRGLPHTTGSAGG